ncbi:unnamed protein product [Didymodactylos carnosus]|uniref:Mitochondrial import inner membrane translocase subunit Tim21 n=1 Tax=Didymodactylos carnosus TaxID=1234261 RepID=A0A814G9T1_9BILA|nr:unnamed protein product [Didymodactylos carnosus]CAF0991350.1 unnamed protein product [Didymodactylos carnosus]CAF3629744.1 unnamed protein product [Didymodactylos carnosus]CAF3763283.1 unnamed protein product [Didymodactylos carnosus]
MLYVFRELYRQVDNRARTDKQKAVNHVQVAERRNVTDQLRMKYADTENRKKIDNDPALASADRLKTTVSDELSSAIPQSLILNRKFSTEKKEKSLDNRASAQTKEKSSKDTNVLIQFQNTNGQIQTATLGKKAQQAAKDVSYTLIIVAGIGALGGLCYIVLRELWSRETPNGIYKEASKLCLENSNVQDALGTPIMVHTTPQIGSMRINNVRAKLFDEKGRKKMTLTFYLTGKQRSGVVAVKVEKNISNRYIYDYIFIQLDRPWKGFNVIDVRKSDSASLTDSSSPIVV